MSFCPKKSKRITIFSRQFTNDSLKRKEDLQQSINTVGEFTKPEEIAKVLHIQNDTASNGMTHSLDSNKLAVLESLGYAFQKVSSKEKEDYGSH